MVKSEEKTAEKPPLEQPSQCLLCGQVGPALLYGHWICDHCKNVIQAEALARKRKIEMEGGGFGVGERVLFRFFSGKSLLHKPIFVLRQAQHEREHPNVFNTYSVRPEPVEG